jgi:hypothetical protein
VSVVGVTARTTAGCETVATGAFAAAPVACGGLLLVAVEDNSGLGVVGLDPESGIPRNPMINAGAIATTAQIRRHAGEGAEAQLLAFFSERAGRPLGIDASVYASERDTGRRSHGRVFQQRRHPARPAPYSAPGGDRAPAAKP